MNLNDNKTTLKKWGGNSKLLYPKLFLIWLITTILITLFCLNIILAEPIEVEALPIDQKYYIDIPIPRLFSIQDDAICYIEENSDSTIKLVVKNSQTQKEFALPNTLKKSDTFKIELKNNLLFLFSKNDSYNNRILVLNLTDWENKDSLPSGAFNATLGDEFGTMPIALDNMVDVAISMSETNNSIFVRDGNDAHQIIFEIIDDANSPIKLISHNLAAKMKDGWAAPSTPAAYKNMFVANSTSVFRVFSSKVYQSNISDAANSFIDLQIENAHTIFADESHLFVVDKNKKLTVYQKNADTYSQLTTFDVAPYISSVIDEISVIQKSGEIISISDNSGKVHELTFQNSTLSYKNYYSQSGQSDDRLNGPTAVEVLENNDKVFTYVLDKNNNRIMRYEFDTLGHIMQEKTLEIKIDGKDINIIAADYSKSRLLIIDDSGYLYEHLPNSTSNAPTPLGQITTAGHSSKTDSIDCVVINGVLYLLSTTLSTSNVFSVNMENYTATPILSENSNEYINISASGNGVCYISGKNKVIKVVPSITDQNAYSAVEITLTGDSIDTLEINSLQIDVEGNLFILAKDNKIYKFQRTSDQVASSVAFYESSLDIAPFDNILSASFDTSGRLYFVNNGKNIFMKTKTNSLGYVLSLELPSYEPSFTSPQEGRLFAYNIVSPIFNLLQSTNAFDDVIYISRQDSPVFLVLDKTDDNYWYGITQNGFAGFVEKSVIDTSSPISTGKGNVDKNLGSTLNTLHTSGIYLFKIPVAFNPAFKTNYPNIVALNKPMIIGNREKSALRPCDKCVIEIIDMVAVNSSNDPIWQTNGTIWYHVIYREFKDDKIVQQGTGYILSTDIAAATESKTIKRLKINSKQLGKSISLFEEENINSKVLFSLTDAAEVELLDTVFTKNKKFTHVRVTFENGESISGYILTEYLQEGGLTSMQKLSIILVCFFVLITSAVLLLVYKNRHKNIDDIETSDPSNVI